jgi:hypothetical protein
VAHGLQGVALQYLLPGPGARRGGLAGVLVHVSQQLHQVAVFGLCPLVPSPTPEANTTQRGELVTHIIMNNMRPFVPFTQRCNIH